MRTSITSLVDAALLVLVACACSSAPVQQPRRSLTPSAAQVVTPVRSSAAPSTPPITPAKLRPTEIHLGRSAKGHLGPTDTAGFRGVVATTWQRPELNSGGNDRAELGDRFALRSRCTAGTAELLTPHGLGSPRRAITVGR